MMTLLSKYQQLNRIGLRNLEQIHYQPKQDNPLKTDARGLTPQDRFIVREPMIQLENPIDPAYFGWIYQEMELYFKHRCVYVRDCITSGKRLNVRVISTTPWQHNTFQEPNELQTFTPDFTVIYAPNFKAKPELDGTRSEGFALTHLTKRLILIGGTPCPNEISHAVLGVINLL
jgi:phosphoenolpyruvate carboxykinase (ATP)